MNLKFQVFYGPYFPSNMAAPPSAYKDRHFLAVIGDEVTIAVEIIRKFSS